MRRRISDILKSLQPVSKRRFEHEMGVLRAGQHSILKSLEARRHADADVEDGRSVHLVGYRGRYRLLLEPPSLVDAAIVSHGLWEIEQINLLFRSFRERAVPGRRNLFLDVGAYFGLYSLEAHATGAFDEIHAFEADVHNFCQLGATLFLNRLHATVSAHNLAVSDGAVPTLRFENSLDHAEGNRAGAYVSTRTVSARDVQAVALDRFLDIEGCNLCIKMDVEGHETKALHGMAGLARRNTVVLQVESFPQHQDACFAQCAAMGLTHIHSIAHDHYFASAVPGE